MRTMVHYFSCIMLLACFLLGSANKASGQDKPVYGSPYYVVDTMSTDVKYLVIHPNDIESVNVLKGAAAVEAYGEKAAWGAIVIKTKPHTTLMKLEAMLDSSGIGGADRKLRVCLNKTVVNSPALLLVQDKLFKGVDITTDVRWVTAEESVSGERFINIKTAEKESASR